MYGFILLHLQNTIVRDYGAEKWAKMCKYCGFEEHGFLSAQRYPDQYILKIADAAVDVSNAIHEWLDDREFCLSIMAEPAWLMHSKVILKKLII